MDIISRCQLEDITHIGLLYFGSHDQELQWFGTAYKRYDCSSVPLLKNLQSSVISELLFGIWNSLSGTLKTISQKEQLRPSLIIIIIIVHVCLDSTGIGTVVSRPARRSWPLLGNLWPWLKTRAFWTRKFERYLYFSMGGSLGDVSEEPVT